MFKGGLFMITSLFKDMLPLYSVICALGFLTSLFMCLSINADAKARNLKSRKVYAVLTFFFPFIVGIVYACTRKTAQRLETPGVDNQNKLVKKSIALFVAAVIFYACSVGCGAYLGYTMSGDILGGFSDVETYDMKGNLITEDESMPAYDKDGNKYVLVENITDDDYIAYYEREDTKEQFDYDYCYLDENGYFYYDKDKVIEMDDDANFCDTNGNKYYSIESMFWDENGNMMDYWDSMF